MSHPEYTERFFLLNTPQKVHVWQISETPEYGPIVPDHAYVTSPNKAVLTSADGTNTFFSYNSFDSLLSALVYIYDMMVGIRQIDEKVGEQTNLYGFDLNDKKDMNLS